MPLRRTVFGWVVSAALVVGVTGCGGSDEVTPKPVSGTPPVSPSSPTRSKPVDPTTVAKSRALADYQYFVAFWTKGKLSGNPTYPYDQVMTGEALQLTNSVATADELRGITASGSVKYLRGSVVALNLSAKPSIARVQSCELDQITGVDKKGGQVYRPVGEVSSDTTLTLVGGRWKVSRKAVSGKEDGACAG